MTTSIQNMVKKQSIEVFDSTTMPFSEKYMSHFALTDSLMERSGENDKIFLHFWPSEKVVFLGMQDTKLPYFNDAIQVLKNHDHPYIVRNSGGLGVVSDSGILNFSIILPNQELTSITIDEGYELMHSVINELFDVPVDAIEIADSYCPGDYDLSINGQKISGISQRRRAGSLAIMMYLSISGNQASRSQLMQEFYTAGTRGEDTKFHFPYVNPKLMTTINSALDQEWTLNSITKAIKNRFVTYGADLSDGVYTDELISNYDRQVEKMVARNKKMLKEHFDEGVR